MTLSKRDRLERTIAGEATDRVPVALWRHWPGDDQRASDLVEAVVNFQRQYDWDFVKFTPTSSFMIADYGVEDRWVGSLEGTREYTRRAVTQSIDWTKLRVLDPSKGVLARQVDALHQLKTALGNDVPILQTVFNPLAQAKNISGNDTLIRHMRTAPDHFHEGLKVITESTLRFIDAIRNTGISGIFYAIQHASYDTMNTEEYAAFGRLYDKQILAALNQDWWFNMLHLHGDTPMLDAISDYPVQAVNWHDRESEVSLESGKRKLNAAVCGGLGRWDGVHNGTPEEVRVQAQDAIQQMGGRRFILSTGCVMMITTPTSNIRAVREAVNSQERV